ncbi:MAG: tetratricopeptide repeat protein [Gammaproteobacteria bacterium]
MLKITFVFLSLLFLVACTSTSSTYSSADYHAALAMEYFKMGEKAKAYEKLQQALTQNPKSISALLAMAYYLEKTGDDETARRIYQQTLKLAAHAGAVLNNYGAFLCKNGNKQLGAYYLKQAALSKKYPGLETVKQNLEHC